MKSTVGKVSAIMILLTFIIASVFAINIVRAQNSSNETNVLENVTFDETIDNETTSQGFVVNREVSLNISLNDIVESVNIINETSCKTCQEDVNEPIFDINIEYPEKMIRQEIINIKADVTTDSFVKNVYLKWILPDGFEIISGNQIEICGDIGTCYSEIDVKIDLSANLGSNEIKVVMVYEK